MLNPPKLLPFLALLLACVRLTSCGVSSPSSSSNAPVSMGTTLVALVCQDGVVVGADTRTSVSGYVSNRYALKWNAITDQVMVGRSGSAADTQRLCDDVRWELQSLQYVHHRKTHTVAQVARLLRANLLEQQDQITASLLCVGCNREGQGEIYSISPSGALFKEPNFAITGSGSTFLLGHFDSIFSKGQPDNLLSQEDAIQCVADAIQLAMDRDTSSGGFVRIYLLHKNGRKAITVYPRNGDHEVPSKNGGTDLPGFASVSQ